MNIRFFYSRGSNPVRSFVVVLAAAWLLPSYLLGLAAFGIAPGNSLTDSKVYVTSSHVLDPAGESALWSYLLDPLEAADAAIAAGLSVGEAERTAAALSCVRLHTGNNEVSSCRWQLSVRNDRGTKGAWLQEVAKRGLIRLQQERDHQVTAWRREQAARRQASADLEQQLRKLRAERQQLLQDSGSPKNTAELVRARPVASTRRSNTSTSQESFAKRIRELTETQEKLATEYREAEQKFTPNNPRLGQARQALEDCEKELSHYRMWFASKERASEVGEAEMRSAMERRLEASVVMAAKEALDTQRLDGEIRDLESRLAKLHVEPAARIATLPSHLSAHYKLEVPLPSPTSSGAGSAALSQASPLSATVDTRWIARLGMVSIAAVAACFAKPWRCEGIRDSGKVLGSLPSSLCGAISASTIGKMYAARALGVLVRASELLLLLSLGVALWLVLSQGELRSALWNDYSVGLRELFQQMKLREI